MVWIKVVFYPQMAQMTLLKKGRAETRRRKVTKEKLVLIREIRSFFQWTHS